LPIISSLVGGAGLGKICSVSGCPKFGIVDSFLELFNQSF